MEQAENSNLSPGSSQAKPRHWPRLLIVSVSSAVFWLAQYWYQYYVYEPGVFQTAWVRSHTLSGTTLLAAALFLSIIFKSRPQLAGQWHWRRNLGVAGFIFIIFHVTGAMRFYFGLDYLNPWPAWRGIFFTWNPLENPVIFGLAAYPILIAMAATSSDWAVRKLKRWWKFLHRFVYLAEIFIVFHAVLMGGPVMKTPPGLLLYALGGVVILGQIYWWFRISRLRRFKNAGFWVGLGTILLALILWYLAATLDALPN